ncbi:MAG: sirohydrochlorin cobaltochelatase [Desulfuromonadaceae bacterium]|nr:sirohydrochlorin cobaltochelatase [Desulfuromonadaceae bacterium]
MTSRRPPTEFLIILAHGSRLDEANRAVLLLAAEVRRKTAIPHVEAAFLEKGAPSLAEAIDRCALKGAGRILIFPHFLAPGIHLRRDLPGQIAEARRRYPDIPIRVTPALFESTRLAGLIGDLVENQSPDGGSQELISGG